MRLPNSVFRPYASIGTNLLFFEKGTPTQEIWYYEHRVPEGQKAYSMTRPIKQEHFADCVAWWGGPNREGRAETEQAWRVPIDQIQERNYNLDLKNPHTVAADHGDPEELLAILQSVDLPSCALWHVVTLRKWLPTTPPPAHPPDPAAPASRAPPDPE